jgi:thiosulfate dehydrogenase [quinone] large subunit
MTKSPDTTDAAPAGVSTTSSCDLTLAFLLLRVWLGLRAVLTGIDKWSTTVTVSKPLLDSSGNPDQSGAMVDLPEKIYGLAHYRAMPQSLQDRLDGEPLLPHFLTTPFYAGLGGALIILGLALLLGIKTRIALVLMGLLYIALTVGLILIKQDDGVAWLGIHMGLIAGALVLARHNRFTLTRN